MRSQTIIHKRARRFRKALNGSELGLWVRLKGRQLGGYHFRCQHPIGPYIVDFFCSEARLAIEIDGESHDSPDAQAHDMRRDVWLAARGISTFRIGAKLLKDPDSVVQMILAEVRLHAPSVTPLQLPRCTGEHARSRLFTRRREPLNPPTGVFQHLLRRGVGDAEIGRQAERRPVHHGHALGVEQFAREVRV